MNTDALPASPLAASGALTARPALPEPPSTRAADHGLRSVTDWAPIDAELQGLELISAPGALRALSRDFHWYSPVLQAQLADCRAGRVVRVSTEEDVLRVAGVAARHGLPLTVRAGGTGNYGQCVPLVGGLVMDVTPMMRVLEIAPGRVRAQAGARLADIEAAVREGGQALRLWPSTWRVATLGGFICGGFGGIGSTEHGVLRDPGNLLRCRVVTVEAEPRVIELQGEEIQQVHHAYGTNGILTEVEVALAPATDWVHVLAHFEGSPSGYRQLLDSAQRSVCGALRAFLMSAVDARFAPYYPALTGHFPAGRHALFAMVAPEALADFDALVRAQGGVLSFALNEAALLAAGLPPAWECAYNHTTLQALKADRGWTYLQVAYPQPFDPAVVQRQLQRWGDEVLQHQEFARMGGAPATFGLLLVRWRGAQRQAELIEEIERDGCTVFNPHVVSIEEGGMKTIDAAQIAFKRRADPHGLLNPGKTRGWLPGMARALPLASDKLHSPPSA